MSPRAHAAPTRSAAEVLRPFLCHARAAPLSKNGFAHVVKAASHCDAGKEKPSTELPDGRVPSTTACKIAFFGNPVAGPIIANVSACEPRLHEGGKKSCTVPGFCASVHEPVPLQFQ